MKYRALAAAAALVMAAAGVTASASPSQARTDEPPVRVTCAGPDTDVRCHIRVPAGAVEIQVIEYHDGDWQTTVSSYDQEYLTPVPQRRVSGRTGGVGYDCVRDTMSVVVCELRFRGTVDAYRWTAWSAGWNLGGAKTWGIL